jgi:acyl-CoA thioester hydrolase
MSRRKQRLDLPEHLPLIAKVRILYADTDAMGVVYHGSYIRYLEHARIEYLRERGTVYADVERDGYAVPVTELDVRYTAPARFDDVLTLRAMLIEQTRARLRFAYRVSVEPGDRVGLDRRLNVLVATTGHCCLNPRTGRPVAFPRHLFDLLVEARERDERALAAAASVDK